MRAVRGAVAVAAVAATAGCFDDPSGVTAEELIGLWGAVEMVFTSEADPGQSVDAVGTEGYTYSLQLISGGTYESQLSTPAGEVRADGGTYQVFGDRLTLSSSAGPERSFEVHFNRSLLRLREASSEWDFDGDGTPELATLEMVLDRF